MTIIFSKNGTYAALDDDCRQCYSVADEYEEHIQMLHLTDDICSALKAVIKHYEATRRGG